MHAQVSDEWAESDAAALFRFLQRRGYIRGEPGPEPSLLREASPLTGVDMVTAHKAGVVTWCSKPGDHVEVGQLLGEIVDLEDVDAPREAVKARTSGVLFSLKRHHLVRPGQVISKISGYSPLPWRLTGDLLTV